MNFCFNILEEVVFSKFVHPHYVQSHRHYHDDSHIAAMSNMADELSLKLTPEQKVAIWFHDAVYVPGSPHNEEMSALLMKTVVLQEEIFSDTFGKLDVDIISQIIIDTKKHQPSIEESKLVLDLDMAILASSDYEEYVKKIRKEFLLFDGEQFNKGRAQFLQSVIGSTIFHTELFHNKFDEAAQINLKIELASL